MSQIAILPHCFFLLPHCRIAKLLTCCGFAALSPFPSRFTCWKEVAFEPTSSIFHGFLQKIGTFSQQFRFDPLSQKPTMRFLGLDKKRHIPYNESNANYSLLKGEP
jgi:hypothetical protein